MDRGQWFGFVSPDVHGQLQKWTVAILTLTRNQSPPTTRHGISKVEMRVPTRLQNGEGRTDGEEIDRSTRPIRRGSWAWHAGKVMRVTGETRPVGGRGFTVACGGGSDGSRTGAQYC